MLSAGCDLWCLSPLPLGWVVVGGRGGDFYMRRWHRKRDESFPLGSYIGILTLAFSRVHLRLLVFCLFFSLFRFSFPSLPALRPSILLLYTYVRAERVHVGGVRGGGAVRRAEGDDSGALAAELATAAAAALGYVFVEIGAGPRQWFVWRPAFACRPAGDVFFAYRASGFFPLL